MTQYLRVACPQCKSPKGVRCRKGGATLRRPHGARRAAAKKTAQAPPTSTPAAPQTPSSGTAQGVA